MSDTLFELPESFYVRRRCIVCGVALSIVHDYTYVVQRQGYVKVGGTNRPRKRINELSRVDWKNYCLSPEGMDWTEPLIPLSVIGGDIEHETHVRFADCYVIGEWFIPNDEMKSWIEEVTS